jgi:hypothetical protein
MSSTHDKICLPNFTPIQVFNFNMSTLITTTNVESFVLIWFNLVLGINIISSSCTWIKVVISVSMAATWLLAIALVRIPATRRICLVRNGRALSVLCWQFCILWVALRLYDYDDETKATWSLAGKFATAAS